MCVRLLLCLLGFLSTSHAILNCDYNKAALCPNEQVDLRCEIVIGTGKLHWNIALPSSNIECLTKYSKKSARMDCSNNDQTQKIKCKNTCFSESKFFNTSLISRLYLNATEDNIQVKCLNPINGQSEGSCKITFAGEDLGH